MQVNPYLHYNGNCETAFKFYEKAAGGKIKVLMNHESAPPEMQTPPEWKKKIMHGQIVFGDDVLMGADSPPGHFQKPQGFSVTLTVDEAADGEKKFKALSEGGSVTMAYTPTFFAKGFGMCVDQFGIPWMVICPMEMNH
jgi:PhnB protein